MSFNETPRRIKFNTKKILPDPIFTGKFQIFLDFFLFIQNKTVFEWDGAIFHGIIQVISGKAVAVG